MRKMDGVMRGISACTFRSSCLYRLSAFAGVWASERLCEDDEIPCVHRPDRLDTSTLSIEPASLLEVPNSHRFIRCIKWRKPDQSERGSPVIPAMDSPPSVKSLSSTHRDF
jgi:hypothetical protein